MVGLGGYVHIQPFPTPLPQVSLVIQGVDTGAFPWFSGKLRAANTLSEIGGLFLQGIRRENSLGVGANIESLGAELLFAGHFVCSGRAFCLRDSPIRFILEGFSAFVAGNICGRINTVN